jgi:hypothetical protein
LGGATSKFYLRLAPLPLAPLRPAIDTEAVVMHSSTADHETPDRILSKLEPWNDGDEGSDPLLNPAEDGLTIDLAGLRSIPVDALLILLRYIVQPDLPTNRWRQAQVRVAVLAHMVNLDGIGSLSFAALAAELGCSRALISLRSLELIDGLSIDKTRNGKKRSTRETYRKTAIDAHTRAGHRMTVDAEQGASGTDMHKLSAKPT